MSPAPKYILCAQHSPCISTYISIKKNSLLQYVIPSLKICTSTYKLLSSNNYDSKSQVNWKIKKVLFLKDSHYFCFMFVTFLMKKKISYKEILPHYYWQNNSGQGNPLSFNHVQTLTKHALCMKRKEPESCSTGKEYRIFRTNKTKGFFLQEFVLNELNMHKSSGRHFGPSRWPRSKTNNC